MKGTDEHSMRAIAEVSAVVEPEGEGLVATVQDDFRLEKFVCRCGETWADDEREAAREHYDRYIAEGDEG